ncbi:MAG: CoA transferase [Pseudomonadales bacterium]|jgi:2-methylfumaryl-CoA isomerase
MHGILAGMRVVEGSAFVAAPLGGMTLAQLGADVIRFDPIGGGLDYERWPVTASGASLFWAGMNKGKRSIQLDIRRPEAQEIISALLARPGDDSGLFLTNFPARGWLSYENLRKSRNDLIYINILGNRKGGSEVDYTVNPASGFAAVTGDPSDPAPTNHVLPAWDNITGQMAATALLAAERHRRTSGAGQLVEIALKDVALATAGHLGNLAEATVNQVERPRYGNYLYGAFGKDFVSKDGKRFMLVGLTPKQWQAIINATGIAETVANIAVHQSIHLETQSQRFEHRVLISELISPWFEARGAPEVTQALTKAGVCFGPYHSFQEMLEQDPDCSEDNPLFDWVAQPGIGEYLAPANPIRFGTSANLPALRAPTLGEHSEEILAQELGLSAHQIAKLFDDKIVA